MRSATWTSSIPPSARRVDLGAYLDARHEELLNQHVERQARKEVVRREEREVEAAKASQGVLVGDVAVDALEADAGVDAADQPPEDVHLERPGRSVGGLAAHDAREVRVLDPVEVDHHDPPNAEVGELLDEHRAATAGAEHAHREAAEPRLTCTPEHEGLSRVAQAGRPVRQWVPAELDEVWPHEPQRNDLVRRHLVPTPRRRRFAARPRAPRPGARR